MIDRRTGVRTGVALDVHLLETGVTPPIGVLLLDVEQFLVPVPGTVGPGLLHHAVDFLAATYGQTGVWIAGEWIVGLVIK